MLKDKYPNIFSPQMGAIVFSIFQIFFATRAVLKIGVYLRIILPLFTEIEKNNCFSIYKGSDLNNIFRRKPLKIDLIDLSIHAFTPAILFLFGLRIIHSVGGE